MPPVVAALVALTDEARYALGGADELPVSHFPFRVGRESRTAKDEASSENDVYLIENREGHALHVSSQHFAIERADEQFFLVDCSSACGTIVAGRRIGGNREGGRTELRDGDEIIVGTRQSRYAFRFAVFHHES